MKKQLHMMANHIWGLMQQGNYEEAKGAKVLSLKVLQLPFEMVKDEQGATRKREVVKEFIAEFARIDL